MGRAFLESKLRQTLFLYRLCFCLPASNPSDPEMTGIRFHDAFWYPSTKVDDFLSPPDLKAGLNVLHERLGHSELENEDIIRYIRARIASEQQYAETLSSLESVPCFSHVQET